MCLQLAEVKSVYSSMGIVETVADNVANMSGNSDMYGGDITEMTQLLRAVVEQVDVTILDVHGDSAEVKAKAIEKVKKVNKVSVLSTCFGVEFPLWNNLVRQLVAGQCCKLFD